MTLFIVRLAWKTTAVASVRARSPEEARELALDAFAREELFNEKEQEPEIVSMLREVRGWG